MTYCVEQNGVFRGEQHFAIYKDGQHPDGGHAWVEEWLTVEEAHWLCDMLNTSDELAIHLLGFISAHPDASWPAIRTGWAMAQGVPYGAKEKT